MTRSAFSVTGLVGGLSTCQSGVMQKLVVVIAVLSGLVGGAGFLRGWSTGKADLLQASGPVVVASLALLGAAAGLST